MEMSELFKKKDNSTVVFHISLKMENRYELIQLIRQYGGKTSVKRGEGVIHIGYRGQQLDMLDRRYKSYSSELILEAIRTGIFDLDSDKHLVYDPGARRFFRPWRILYNKGDKLSVINRAGSSNPESSSAELTPSNKLTNAENGSDTEKDSLTKTSPIKSNLNSDTNNESNDEPNSVKREYSETESDAYDGARFKRERKIYTDVIDLTDDDVNSSVVSSSLEVPSLTSVGINGSTAVIEDRSLENSSIPSTSPTGVTPLDSLSEPNKPDILVGSPSSSAGQLLQTQVIQGTPEDQLPNSESVSSSEETVTPVKPAANNQTLITGSPTNLGLPTNPVKKETGIESDADDGFDEIELSSASKIRLKCTHISGPITSSIQNQKYGVNASSEPLESTSSPKDDSSKIPKVDKRSYKYYESMNIGKSTDGGADDSAEAPESVEDVNEPNESGRESPHMQDWAIEDDDKLFQGLAHYQFNMDDAIGDLCEMFKLSYTEDEIKRHWSIISKNYRYMKNLFDRPFIKSISCYNGEVFHKKGASTAPPEQPKKRVLYNDFEDRICFQFLKAFQFAADFKLERKPPAIPYSVFVEAAKRFPHHTIQSWKERWKVLRFKVENLIKYPVSIGEMIKYSNELGIMYIDKTFLLANNSYKSLIYAPIGHVDESGPLKEKSLTSRLQSPSSSSPAPSATKSQPLATEILSSVEDNEKVQENLTSVTASKIKEVNPFSKKRPPNAVGTTENDFRKFPRMSDVTSSVSEKLLPEPLADSHSYREKNNNFENSARSPSGGPENIKEEHNVKIISNEDYSVAPTENNYDADQGDLFSQFASNLGVGDSQWGNSQNEVAAGDFSQNFEMVETTTKVEAKISLTQKPFDDRRVSMDSVSSESIRNPFLNETHSSVKPHGSNGNTMVVWRDDNGGGRANDRDTPFSLYSRIPKSPVDIPAHSQALRPGVVKLSGTDLLLKRLLMRFDNSLDDILDQMKILYNTDEATVLGSIVSTSFFYKQCHEYLKYSVDHNNNWPPSSDRKKGWWDPEHDKLIESSDMMKNSDEIKQLIGLHGYNCTQFRLNFVLLVHVNRNNDLPAKLKPVLERYNVTFEFFSELLDATFDLWVTIDYLEKSNYRTKVPTLPGFWSFEESETIVNGTHKELLEELILFHGQAEVMYRRQMLLVLQAYVRFHSMESTK